MLSAKKVKLHGLEDDRWVTRDKITQYKGLLNLYSRDKKIIDNDTNILCKKQQKQLKTIHKDITEKRAQLDNAIKGDRQLVRNKLQDHQDMQMKYQNIHPRHIIEHMVQDNFNMRKYLDRCKYKMKLETQKLIGEKLRLSQMEDEIKYENISKLAVEEEAEIITGKVQDAVLRKEAALAVQYTYKNILDIMKKDSVYFDAVLEALKQDGYNQGLCMVTATELGQLATEYLDDRKQEFKKLEKNVMKDLRARLKTLKAVRTEAEELNANMRYIIRRDSDINLGKVEIEPSTSEQCLFNDMQYFEEKFKELQQITAVTHFDYILPCIEEQKKQHARLNEFIAKVTAKHDNLLNKKNQAETMYSSLANTMVETTQQYVEGKKILLEKIMEQHNQKSALLAALKIREEIFANVRLGLQQLVEICQIIVSPKKDIKAVYLTPTPLTEIPPPEKLEEDGIKLLEILQTKLGLLVGSASDFIIDKEDEIETETKFQSYIQHVMKTVQCDKEFLEEESLIDTMITEDVGVPSRQEIKLKSQELVELNAKTDEEPEKGVHKHL